MHNSIFINECKTCGWNDDSCNTNFCTNVNSKNNAEYVDTKDTCEFWQAIEEVDEEVKQWFDNPLSRVSVQEFIELKVSTEAVRDFSKFIIDENKKSFKKMLTEQVTREHAQEYIKPGVYLILAENGLTKIGRSQNVDKRFQTIKAQSPLKMHMLFYISTTSMSRLENELHKKYKSKRVNGEWFNLSHNEIEEIYQDCKSRLLLVKDVAYLDCEH